MSMNPEEKARLIIDEKLKEVGWDIVSRDEYVPGLALAVKEAIMLEITKVIIFYL